MVEPKGLDHVVMGSNPMFGEHWSRSKMFLIVNNIYMKVFDGKPQIISLFARVLVFLLEKNDESNLDDSKCVIIVREGALALTEDRNCFGVELSKERVEPD